MSLHVFDPVDMSFEENRWLLDHLGEPWVVASRTIRPVRLPNPHPKDKDPVYYPDGVNPNAVRPVIDRVYELAELEKHSGAVWVGLEAVKSAISTYLEQAEKWQTERRKNRVRFPSLATWLAGRPHLQGPGSDSGKVKTYIDAQGNRHPFALELAPADYDTGYYRIDESDPPAEGLTVNQDLSRIECFCGHVEKFNKESRGSFNVARGRMSKHLRSTTDQVDKHRELYTKEFGG